MEFINYYDLLRVARNAKPEHIERAFTYFVGREQSKVGRDLLMEVYATLSNPYRRARYDKTAGYLLTIQSLPTFVSAGLCYQLAKKIQPLLVLQRIKNNFQDWTYRKWGYTWEEAEEAKYNYRVSMENDNPHIIFCAPVETDLEEFAKNLLDAKLIKPVEDNF